MKNETPKNETPHSGKTIQTRSQQDPWKESTQVSSSWWLSLINDQDAWEKRVIDNTRHYDTEIPETDFLGTSPPFSWE